jgi:hypothetical protein
VFRPPEPAAEVGALGGLAAAGAEGGAFCRCASIGTAIAASVIASMICFMTFNFAL